MKIRKTKMLLAAAVLVVSLGFTACGNQPGAGAEPDLSAPGQEASGQESSSGEDMGAAVSSQDTVPVEESSSGIAGASSDTMDAQEIKGSPEGLDHFSVDSKTVADFAEKIQKAVADRDLESLADLTAFPTYVGFPEEGTVVNTREEFLALGEDKIFTDELLSSIEDTDLSGLEPCMAGFFMQTASGENMPSITFGLSDGSLAISGINY